MNEYIGHNWTYEPVHLGNGVFKIAIYDEKHNFVKYMEEKTNAKGTHHKQQVNQD